MNNKLRRPRQGIDQKIALYMMTNHTVESSMLRFPIGSIFLAAINSYAIKKGEQVELIAYARIPKTGETIGQFRGCQSGSIDLLSFSEIQEIDK